MRASAGAGLGLLALALAVFFARASGTPTKLDTLPPPQQKKVAELERQHMDPAACSTTHFLTQGPRSYTGGFNNMLMSMQSAISLARKTNRTYIIPAQRNARYRDLRFRDVLDLGMLRQFWPCVVEADRPWGESMATDDQKSKYATTMRYPGAKRGRRLQESGDEASEGLRGLAGRGRAGGGASARALLGRRGGGGKGGGRGKGKGGECHGGGFGCKTDYKPAPGSIASLAAMRLQGVVAPGRTLESVAEFLSTDATAREHPNVMISGSAWGGFMTLCHDPADDELFWRHVWPVQGIEEEVATFTKEKLPKGNYVGVHTRWLEGKCPGRAMDYYVPGVGKSVAAMCSNNIKLTQQIIKAKGLSPGHVFLASDRQRPPVDKAFAKAGTVSYDRGNTQDKYYGGGTQFVKGRAGREIFEPGVDMFLLVGADLFIGNMVSTFSTNVASVRMSRGRPSILGWPEPKTKKSFWECERAHFWCGTPLRKWSSVGKTKNHGTC